MDDVDVVKAIYEAMAARDFGAIFERLDEWCVITQDDRLPWGGKHVGHNGFAELGIALSSTITSAVTIEAIFAADDEVIQVGRTKGTVVATGAPFDIPEVHRWKLRDGKAIEAHFAIDTPAMLAVLGG